MGLFGFSSVLLAALLSCVLTVDYDLERYQGSRR